MRKIKGVFLGVLLMGITMTGLAACVPDRRACEEQAAHMLQEKYQEEFKIES